MSRPSHSPARVVTLLTDFGLRDGYVAAMKGVILSRAPGTRVVDICHDIPPQDIRRGGLVWSSAAPFFPAGTVHVGVVDPGVGTSRRVLAIEARGQVFLAPDNGILGYVIGRREIRGCFAVARRDLFLERVSSTFHGRDIFAPVAARIAGGLSPAEVGPAARPARWEELPRPRRRRLLRGRGRLLEERGEILSVDAFGDAMTSLRPAPGRRLISLRAGGRVSFDRLWGVYAEVPAGRALLLVGSMGYLEVAVNRGRASDLLGLKPGDPVVALWGPIAGRRARPAGRR